MNKNEPVFKHNDALQEEGQESKPTPVRKFPEQRRVRLTTEQARGLEIAGRKLYPEPANDPQVIRDAVDLFLEANDCTVQPPEIRPDSPLNACPDCGVRRGFHAQACPRKVD